MRIATYLAALVLPVTLSAQSVEFGAQILAWQYGMEGYHVARSGYPGLDWPIGHHVGFSSASAGDLNGDGIPDLIVGAPNLTDDVGRVRLLGLTANGTVSWEDTFQESGNLGHSVAGLGLLPDGVRRRVAAGASTFDNRGRVLVGDLTPRPFGVEAGNRVYSTPVYTARAGKGFGTAMTNIGDIDGNGYNDLAVADSGLVAVFRMDGNGFLAGVKEFGQRGSIIGDASSPIEFGASMASVGDDYDYATTVFVGAPSAPGPFVGSTGALYAVNLDADGEMVDFSVIENPSALLDATKRFGTAVANVGDLDLNSSDDLVVSWGEGDNRGVYVLFMKKNAQLKPAILSAQRINLSGTGAGRQQGFSLSAIDGLGPNQRLMVGEPGATFGHGAIATYDVGFDGTLTARDEISSAAGSPLGYVKGDRFGWSIAAYEAPNGNPRLLVGAPGDPTGGIDAGAVWNLKQPGLLSSIEEVITTAPWWGPSEMLEMLPGYKLGTSIAYSEALESMIVGTPGRGKVARIPIDAAAPGAYWAGSVTRLSGTYGASTAVSKTGGFYAVGEPSAKLVQLFGLADDQIRNSWTQPFPNNGKSLAILPDMNGDGTEDIAVGADNQVQIVFLGPGGVGFLDDVVLESPGGHEGFGQSIVSAGDLDGNGMPDLIVGSTTLGSVFSRGALEILFMEDRGAGPVIKKSVTFDQSDMIGDVGPNSGFAWSMGLLDRSSPSDKTLWVGIPGYEDDVGRLVGLEFTVVEAVTVEAKVSLQGPYDPVSGEMSTNLVGLTDFPLSQPFSGLPWSYPGDEDVVVVPEGVVDWVLVEVRDTPDGPAVGRRAAFIDSEGKLVELDGQVGVSMDGVAPGSYHLIIRHRNHLAIRSDGSVDLN